MMRVPAREAFEAIVDRRRGPRANPTLAEPLVEQVVLASARSVGRSNHNLPRSLTSFIGREQELTV